jgi:hypothetical protein
MTTKTTLVGKWVHTFGQKGDIKAFPHYTPLERQGYIAAEMTDDEKSKPSLYEVRWFSWATGDLNRSTLVSPETMHFEGWAFYDSEEQWLARAEANTEMLNMSFNK